MEDRTEDSTHNKQNFIYFLRCSAVAGIQDNFDGRIRAAGPLVRPLPHTVRETRIKALWLSEEQGVSDQSLGGNI